MDYRYYSDNNRPRYGMDPFYLVYPDMWGDGYEDFMRDAEYFTSMYPREAFRLREHIKKALELLDYPGSILYDEFPDRIALHKLSLDIRAGIRDMENVEAKADLIDVLLLQELLERRHVRKRKFYNF